MRGERGTIKNLLKVGGAVFFSALAIKGQLNPPSVSAEPLNQQDSGILCSPGTSQVTVNGARARTGAGTEYPIDSRLTSGQTVEVDGPVMANYDTTSAGVTSRTWCEITLDGKTLYVFSGLVSPISGNPPQTQNAPVNEVATRTNGLNLDNCPGFRDIGSLPDGAPVYVLRSNSSSLSANQIIQVLNYMSNRIPHTLWAGSDWYQEPVVIKVSDTTNVINTQGYMGMTTPADENQCSLQASNHLLPNTVRYVFASSRWGQEAAKVLLIHQLSVVYGANDLGNGQLDDTFYWGRADKYVSGDISNSGAAGRAMNNACEPQDQDCTTLQNILSNP